VRQIVNNSGLKRKLLSFNNFWKTVQLVYHENKSQSKQADIPVFKYSVNDDLQDIVFVLKFRENGICCTPVGKAKEHNINAIGDDGNTVYHNKNPFRCVLINPVVPESERNNLQKQIQRISVCQSRNIKLKTTFQQIDQVIECHVGEIIFVYQKEKNATQVINCQHQHEIIKKNSYRFCFYTVISQL
jgi:hypothetical protein